MVGEPILVQWGGDYHAAMFDLAPGVDPITTLGLVALSFVT